MTEQRKKQIWEACGAATIEGRKLMRLTMLLLMACAVTWGQSYDPTDWEKIELCQVDCGGYPLPDDGSITTWPIGVLVPVPDQPTDPAADVPETDDGSATIWYDISAEDTYNITADISLVVPNYAPATDLEIGDEYFCPDLALDIFVQYNGHQYQTETLVAATALIKVLKEGGHTVTLKLSFAGCD